MNKRIVLNPEVYPIQPDQINAQEHFWEAFGSQQKEVSARWIVMFCQKQGSWCEFSVSDLLNFYNEAGYHDFRFNGLDEEGFVIVKYGTCRVTHEFVARCFLSSPAVKGIE